MKILVLGSDGLVGKAFQRSESEHEFFFATRKDADLTKEKEVEKLFAKVKPDVVIMAAARVGGVFCHGIYPAELYHQNTLMNAFVIHQAYKHEVKKLLAFSSVCAFPDKLPILREDLLHDGKPFDGNYAYAHAKRNVDTQIRAYRDQYDLRNYCTIIPGNIWGKEDNYNLNYGHVLPALQHRLLLAKRRNTPLVVWGDGTPLREFIYADDLARMLLQILELENIPERILISGSKQCSIKEMVEKLCKVANFKGEVLWDTSKPNGQKQRPSDISLLKSLVDYQETDIDVALQESWEWLISNYNNIRK